jgi:hypothetical protein
VRREQHRRLAAHVCRQRRQRLAHAIGQRLDVAGGVRVAVDPGDLDAAAGGGPVQRRERRPRGAARVVREEGQGDRRAHAVGAHGGHRLLREGVPAGHGHVGARFDAALADRLGDGRGLGLGLLADGRAAADLGVGGARERGPALGDHAGQERLGEAGPAQLDDLGIGEEVAQEGLHRLRRIGATQVEEDDAQRPHRAHSAVCTARTRASTFSSGVSG